MAGTRVREHMEVSARRRVEDVDRVENGRIKLTKIAAVKEVTRHHH